MKMHAPKKIAKWLPIKVDNGDVALAGKGTSSIDREFNRGK